MIKLKLLHYSDYNTQNIEHVDLFIKWTKSHFIRISVFLSKYFVCFFKLT